MINSTAWESKPFVREGLHTGGSQCNTSCGSLPPLYAILFGLPQHGASRTRLVSEPLAKNCQIHSDLIQRTFARKRCAASFRIEAGLPAQPEPRG